MGTLYEELKKASPISISFHDDADGVYSASLLFFVEGIEVRKVKTVPSDERIMVESPKVFGDYKYSVAVDLGSPLNKNWNGIAIDHHPNHPTDRKYKLFWDTVPTGLIIWNHLKDYIPKSEWWRVAGSLMGDASIDYLPAEIWDEYPELFDEKGILYRDRYWKTKMSRSPLYVFLSSGINARCRLGDPLGALQMCLKYKSPVDAVLDPEAISAKKLLEVEETNILKQQLPIEVIGNKFAVTKIRSSRPEYSMSGKIASTLASQYPFLTIIVLNESNGEVSIRGVLAKYVADKLNANGFQAGGHPSASGCTVPIEKFDDFMKFIRSLGVR